MKRNERWEVVCQNQPSKLAQFISYVFSDQYLYVHPSFRRTLQADRKGYVHVDELMKQDPIACYFQANPAHYQTKMINIRSAVDTFCNHLKFTSNRVRRLSPFQSHLFAHIKPICIERVKCPLTISDVRQYVGSSAFSPYEQFQPQQDIRFLYVYAPHYRQDWKNGKAHAPFTVLPYDMVCLQRQRESRNWQQNQKRFYSTIDLDEMNQMMSRKEMMKQELDEIERQIKQYRIEPQELISVDEIRTVLRPSSEINNLLSTYIASMDSRVDEQ